VRTPDGKGSGYGICDFNDAKKLDTGSVSAIAAEKAARSRETRALSWKIHGDPGAVGRRST
jgi:hypothetical protein